MNKTKEELRDGILRELSASIGINITDEGSIALAIVDALIDEIYLLHREIEYIRNQSYITTSNSGYTELIADLVNIKRNEFESDDNLKLRAQNSVYAHAGGNIIAIEEAARSVSGVAKIEYRPFGYGTGSFVIYVYPEAHENQYRLIQRVEEAIREVASEGVYFEIKAPTEVPVDLEIVLNIEDGLSFSEQNIVKSQVETQVRRYLNSFEMNDILYINEIITTVMNTREEIVDVNIIEYKVGGTNRPLTNTYPANEERFISGRIGIN